MSVNTTVSIIIVIIISITIILKIRIITRAELYKYFILSLWICHVFGILSDQIGNYSLLDPFSYIEVVFRAKFQLFDPPIHRQLLS